MRLAVVTGAAAGIGKAVAESLGHDDYHVILVDRSPRVKETAEELRSNHLQITPVEADIFDPSGRERIKEIVKAQGWRLRALVNNAGITRDALIDSLEEEDFLKVVRVNLGGAYLLTHDLLPFMGEGSAIVNVSSRAYLGNVGQFNYAASKGGLVGLTRGLALELAPKIRVNAVAPGLIRTDMSLSIPERVREKLLARIPMRRMGETNEVANVIRFLVSEEASYITGQVVLICGGRSIAV